MGCHIDNAEAPHGQSEPRRRQVFLPLSGAAGGATAATDGEGATGGQEDILENLWICVDIYGEK